jgi:hypothetical protein
MPTNANFVAEIQRTALKWDEEFVRGWWGSKKNTNGLTRKSVISKCYKKFPSRGLTKVRIRIILILDYVIEQKIYW